MLRKVRITTNDGKDDEIVESGMDDHCPNNVPGHKEFESQEDRSSQILTTDTVCVQGIGLAFQEKTGRCDDRSCNNQADFIVLGGRSRALVVPGASSVQICLAEGPLLQGDKTILLVCG